MEAFIKKGMHYSFVLPKIYWDKKNLSYDILFTESCTYNLCTADQYDINKLFGLSFGFHHNNSIRFGWRWNIETCCIDIFAYAYVNWIRNKETKIYSAKINQVNRYSIKVQPEIYELTITDLKFGYKTICEIKHGKLNKLGYALHPYFGGNMKAPHDMEIMFNKH